MAEVLKRLPKPVKKRLKKLAEHYVQHVSKTVEEIKKAGKPLKGHTAWWITLKRLETDRRALELASEAIKGTQGLFKAGGWFDADEVIKQAARENRLGLSPTRPMKNLLKFLERNPDLVDLVLAAYVAHIHGTVTAHVETLLEEGDELAVELLKKWLKELAETFK